MAEIETTIDANDSVALDLRKIVDLNDVDLMCDVGLGVASLIQTDYIENTASYEDETY